MKHLRSIRPLVPLILAATLAGASHAANTDIASVPLVTSAPNAVLPNLMFVLDDSGSMAWDFLPDLVDDSRCRSSGATGTNSGNWGLACQNEPPYRSSSYNGVYYNPAVTYLPPLYANGTSWPAQTSANTAGWTSVRNDAYGVQSAGSTNLITGYPDVRYCTDATLTDCLRNGNYVLPGTVNGKNYTTRDPNVTATGTGSLAVGTPDGNPNSAGVTTVPVSFGPHYYVINPGEYCTGPNLRTCQTSANATYKYPAPFRWCNSDANARAANPAVGSCQALNTPTYNNLRIPTKFFTPAVAATAGTADTPAKATITVSLNGTCNGSNQVSTRLARVNGALDLYGGATSSLASTANNIAAAIVTAINAGGTGYSATRSGAVVTVTAASTAGNINGQSLGVQRANANNSCNATFTGTNFSGWVAGLPPTPAVAAGYPGSFARVDIVPTTVSYPRASSRSDCAAATCTYAEEMTNFANWFTYYRTRMQTMKTSASFAFGNLSNQYRVGYFSINNNTTRDFLNLNKFETTQKQNWFSKLAAAIPNNATPLRGALSTVGRLFGGRLNGSTLNGSTVVDPMQYSCQQNFTLLSTDGYWNETATPRQLDGSTAIGDTDSSLQRPLLDGTSTSNTLADVAAYYYETDLRPTGSSYCTSATGGDLCTNNVPVGGVDQATHQHMTTFTLGLGVSGYMLFDENYRTATSGDFFDVANGTPANPTNGVCTWQTSGACNWPVPVNNSPPNVDDLWHAAVNGRGTYFTAKDPASLYTGLARALAAINDRRGASAAATTSNPNISAGDNSIFISRFFSGQTDWSGELTGQKIDIATGGIVSSATDWSANDQLTTNTSRTILMYDAGAASRLKPFTWASLTSSERSYFVAPYIKTPGVALSQFCSFGTTCLSATDQVTAEGSLLVNFLRGDRSHEGTSTDTTSFYRQRLSARVPGSPPVPALLGDIVNSEALYVKKALYNYADSGYASFKTGTASRRAMVYVGANDGMLHAFDATTGAEVWAYIPTMVLPKLYRLADKDYARDHQFYVDSSPVSGDIFDGTSWKTILVGGLGAGGRGYYALDITDPNNPKALWEFTHNNLGLTFGKAEVTKLKDGTWVVLVASGYNNVSPGDGQGRLFVLRASDGSLIRTIDTGVGSTATPSGMAQIRAWVDRTDVNNTTLRVYGGDNLGNLWRFDVNNDVGAGGYDAQLLATLRDTAGNTQPLTARPELGLVNGNAMVYVGTGRYLGVTDLSDRGQQTIYAVKDTLGSTGWGNPRSSGNFVQQALTQSTCPTGSSVCVPGQTVRLGSSNAVDLTTKGGWYVDLPITSERANTDPQLALGLLVVSTNVVDPQACTSGGTSYLNFFDYRTGGASASALGVSSVLLGNSLASRTNVIKVGEKVEGVTTLSEDRTSVNTLPPPPNPNLTRRISWRELTN